MTVYDIDFSAILGALDAGKLPSTQQVNAAIDQVLQSELIQVEHTKSGGTLSERGKVFAGDLREILEAYKQVGNEKNGDDQLQEAIWNLTQGEIKTNEEFVDASKKEASTDAERLSTALKTIVNVLLFHGSSEGGGALGDLTSLTRNVLADTAEVVEHTAAATKDSLRQTEEQKQRGERDALGRKPTQEGEMDTRQKFEARMDYAKDVGSQAIGAGQGAKRAGNEISARAHERFDALFDTISDRTLRDPQYRNAITTIFDIIQKWLDKSVDTVDRTAEQGESLDALVDDPSGRISSAFRSLRVLAERLAGGKSIDDLLHALRICVLDIRRDEGLKQFFRDYNGYARKTLEEPGYARSEEQRRRRTELQQRWNQLRDEDSEQSRKWRQDFELLQTEYDDFVGRLAEDPSLRRLQQAHVRLARHVAGTAEVAAEAATGQAPWVWQDFLNVVLPRVIGLVKSVPIPRTEYKDQETEFVIEHLDISRLSLLPGKAHISNTTDLDVSQQSYDTSASTSVSTRSHIRLTGVQFTAHDVSFWYRDAAMKVVHEISGLLDINLPERGVDVDIKLALIPTANRAEREKREAFHKIESVKVSLHDVSLNISKSNHKVLTSVFKSAVNKVVAQQIEKTLEENVRLAIETADKIAYDVHKRALVFKDAGVPTTAAYISGMWSELGHMRQLPGLLSYIRTTDVGIIKDDPRSSNTIAIGAEPQIISGEKHGPRTNADASAAHAQGRQKVEEAARMRDAAGGSPEGMAAQAKAKATTFKQSVEAHSAEEKQRDGWKSDAFDVNRQSLRV